MERMASLWSAPQSRFWRAKTTVTVRFVHAKSWNYGWERGTCRVVFFRFSSFVELRVLQYKASFEFIDITARPSCGPWPVRSRSARTRRLPFHGFPGSMGLDLRRRVPVARVQHAAGDEAPVPIRPLVEQHRREPGIRRVGRDGRLELGPARDSRVPVQRLADEQQSRSRRPLSESDVELDRAEDRCPVHTGSSASMSFSESTEPRPR